MSASRPEHYSQELQMRQPMTLVVIAVSLCIAFGTMWYREPWYAWAPFFAMAGYGAWHFLQNTKWGVELTDEELITWFGRKKRRVSLSDIDRVELASWDECDFRVMMKDGSKLKFSSESLENRAAIESGLRSRGIAVKRS